MIFKKPKVSMLPVPLPPLEPSPRFDLNNFNFKSTPMPSLNLPQEIKIVSLGVSVDGNSGVILIELPEGSFVLKASITIPCEFFYSSMGESLGLCVPKMREMVGDSYEYFRLLEAVEKYCGVNDEALFYRLRSRFNNIFYCIMEYIPSIGYEKIGTSRFKSMIEGGEALYELGCGLGYDMLVNNHDRLRLIWGGEGNIDNLLIKVAKEGEGERGEGHVFIDNEGHMCDVGVDAVRKNMERYFNKFVDVLGEVLRNLEGENGENIGSSEYFGKLIVQLELYTGHKLENSELEYVCMGILDTIEKFMSLWKQGKIGELYERVKSYSQTIKCSIIAKEWNNQLQHIHLNFLELLYSKIKVVLSEHRERKKQCKQEQLSQPL